MTDESSRWTSWRSTCITPFSSSSASLSLLTHMVSTSRASMERCDAIHCKRDGTHQAVAVQSVLARGQLRRTAHGRRSPVAPRADQHGPVRRAAESHQEAAVRPPTKRNRRRAFQVAGDASAQSEIVAQVIVITGE